MTQELQTLSTLIKMYLEQLSPVLSGNMRNEINTTHLLRVNDHDVLFCVEAPFYDMKKWKETGVIVHTNKKIDKITDYAMWVNEVGAFGSHNESMHWLNRALNDVARVMPNAEVINELEL